MKRENPIPEYKKKNVSELSNLIKDKKTILVASIKNIPASQFQEIGKKIRDKAIIKVPKKNMIFRAIDESKVSELEEIKKQLDNSFAVLFSDIDCYELAGNLLKNTSPAKAKPGQEAPEDIEVEAGPTDLVPGPAISELGALGIQIQIEKGKIHIKESKIIAKKGSKISQGAADLMSKLDIKPFKIGFVPLCAFDTQDKKLYLEINIDSEKAVEDLKIAFGKSIGFAVGINYVCKDTIGLFLQKAGAHANKINRIMTGEPEVIEESSTEESPKEEIKEEKKEEAQVDAGAGLASLFG